LSYFENFEDLAAKAKSVGDYPLIFGVEICVACSHKGHQDWQVTLFDDSWVSYMDLRTETIRKTK
jgi:hypothetical protein